MNHLALIRPGVTEAIQLLGQWIVCRVSYDDGEAPCDTPPAQVVGVVVPATGGPVLPRLLMNSCPRVKISDGVEYDLYLDTIMHVRVVEPPYDALRLPLMGPGLGTGLA